MSITRRGLIWEILNSLWIGFSVFNMAFVSFFYIGSKTKNMKWKFYGAIYFLVNIVSLIFVGILPSDGIFNTISNILIGIWLLGFFVGIIHSVIVRKEYLVRREYILESGIEEAEIERLKEDVHSEYKQKNYFGPSGNDTQMDSTYYSNMSYRDYETVDANDEKEEFEYRNKAIVEGNEDILNNSKYFTYGQEDNKGDLINLNTCSKEELLNLPGIDDQKAEKIMSLRNMMGGFNSVQEFIDMTRIDSSYSELILQKATVREKTID